MKKQNIVNLVRYHAENNNDAFRNEVAEIAKEFSSGGDELLARYLMELVSCAGFYVPQINYSNLRFLTKKEYSAKPLFLPDVIEEDIMGIVRAVKKKSEMKKFLFHGAAGTGKTESAYQVARMLEREILLVNVEELIDSRLGESAKNIVKVFDEINRLPEGKACVVFDELDALVLDRVNANDLREMGRVTSAFLKGLDGLGANVVLIATTNLLDHFDKALIRRFDAVVSFNRYSRQDLCDVAEEILKVKIRKNEAIAKDIRLFRKILAHLENIPYPGDMEQIIRSAIAFSDDTNSYDYLRKIYLALNGNPSSLDIHKLSEEKYTTREVEILTRVPKSSVARRLKGEG